MKKILLVVFAVALSSAAVAGDVEDAKAMLEKAAAAIKADREVALAQFNRGQFNRGNLDISKDFYPFCIRLTDGKLIASPFLAATIGNDVRNGKIGKELSDAMMKQPEGVISGEINYLYPKPGTTARPLPKTSFAMRVAPDLGCAVGYYK